MNPKLLATLLGATAMLAVWGMADPPAVYAQVRQTPTVATAVPAATAAPAATPVPTVATAAPLKAVTVAAAATLRAAAPQAVTVVVPTPAAVTPRQARAAPRPVAPVAGHGWRRWRGHERGRRRLAPGALVAPPRVATAAWAAARQVAPVVPVALVAMAAWAAPRQVAAVGG